MPTMTNNFLDLVDTRRRHRRRGVSIGAATGGGPVFSGPRRTSSGEGLQGAQTLALHRGKGAGQVQGFSLIGLQLHAKSGGGGARGC